MIKTRYLDKTACIGIFSPSEPLVDSRRERLNRGIEVLKQNGFKTKFSTNAFVQRAYSAGTIKQRVDDISALARDKDVHALMASWGGKSCNQIIHHVDYNLLRDKKKPVLAFSDGCVLLNAITAKTNLVTYHGPNVAGKLFETKHANLELLTSDSFYRNKQNILGRPEEVTTRIIRKGRAQGRLFGGNLSTFTLGLLGSKYMPKFERGILFWESADLTPQFVDQYLMCLRNGGIFDNLAGMIIGDFIYEESTQYKIRDPFEMINELVNGYKFPVIYCPTFGHPPQLENPIMPIGAMCEIDAENMQLLLLQSISA